MKKTAESRSFVEYIKAKGEALGIKPIEISKEDCLGSPPGLLCQKMHEECLRKMTREFIEDRGVAARRAGDRERLDLANVLLARYETVPYESLIAYWAGFYASGQSPNERAAILLILQRQARACAANFH